MKVEDTEANASRCLCAKQCPTYNECMKGKSERIYCSRGKTDCGPTMNGCNCFECPVHSDHHLTGGYYCLEGAAS